MIHLMRVCGDSLLETMSVLREFVKHYRVANGPAPAWLAGHAVRGSV